MLVSARRVHQSNGHGHYPLLHRHFVASFARRALVAGCRVAIAAQTADACTKPPHELHLCNSHSVGPVRLPFTPAWGLPLGLEISVCAGAFHLGMTRSPDEVVTRFCALWSKPDLDEIASCFTEDAVYRNIPPTPSVEGREAIREFIAEFLARLDGIDFIVHRQISDHGVVMHERTDVLRRKDGAELSVPIMGVFDIADGKIATWRDYFETAITSAFI